MSLMAQFQQKKDPEYGNEAQGGFKVVGSMPGNSIGKQQTITKFEKELANDLEALGMIKSIKQKETEKASHLVPKYMPLVKSLTASGSDHPLLGQILVWIFDIKDIPAAMELALYCIEHEVSMPERFKRDLTTYLCDTIVEWAETEHEAGRSCEPYFTQVCDLAENWDIVDQIRARLFRLRGLIALSKEDWKQAIIEFEYAEEYGAKVKTWLTRAAKKAAAAAENK
ncbi:MAG: hypothetical protein HUK40_19375 [Desulfobacter sp.]|nr:hypothetical protein [Desulfobacter sp.]